MSNEKQFEWYSDKSVKLTKTVLLVVVLFLIVLDVLALVAFKDKMPTISRFVLQSVPMFMCVVWVLGIATISLFAPRKRVLSHKSVGLRKLSTFLVIVVLVAMGSSLRDIGTNLDCGEIDETEYATGWKQHILKVECIQTAQYNYRLIDCQDCIKEKCTTKVNLSVLSKFGLYLVGLLWGAVVWPQRYYEGDEEVKNAK